MTDNDYFIDINYFLHDQITRIMFVSWNSVVVLNCTEKTVVYVESDGHWLNQTVNVNELLMYFCLIIQA